MPDAGIGETIAITALEGAAVGAGVSAVTGGKPLKGAEAGALTGAGIGAGGAFAGDIGLSTTAGEALGGAVGGGVGGLATGQNPLVSAAEGGVSGAISGALAPDATPNGAPSATPTATSSAGSGGGGPVTGSAPIPDTVPTSDVLTPSGGVSSDLAPASSFPGPSQPVTSTDIAAPGTAPPSVTGASPSGPTPLPPGTQPLGAVGAPTTPSSVDTSFAGTNVPAAPPAGQSQAFTPTGETYNVSNATLQAATGDQLTPAASPIAPAEKSTGLLGEPGTFLNKVSSPTTLLGGAALAYEGIKGQQPLPQQAPLNTSANALTAQGQQLASYISSGSLPPGVENSLQTAAQSAKASIRSKYASMGLSGSSSEAQDLANVDANVTSQGVSIAMQLLQQGVSEQNIGNQIYTQLMNAQVQQDNALGSAITNFAIASAGGLPSKAA